MSSEDWPILHDAHVWHAIRSIKYEARLIESRVKTAQARLARKPPPEEPEAFVAGLFREFLAPPPPGFAERSFLRRRDRWRRKNPQHDEHVRAYNSLTPTERQLWQCFCGVSLHHYARPRDAAGRCLKHCGCRTGKSRRGPLVGYKESKRKEYERRKRERLEAAEAEGRLLHRGKYRLHDAHVQRYIGLRPLKHDAHVRTFKAKANEAAYARWRTANDPGYRLNQRLRVQIRKALKGNKAGRSWEAIVGYTLVELVAHLERMLPRGVRLQDCLNADWHIDHIVPKSAFNLSDEAELRRAWCLSNLRLLPAQDNLIKSARHVYLV